MPRVINEHVVFGFDDPVEIVDCLEHRDVVGIIEHLNDEAVLVGQDACGTSGVVARRLEILDGVVLLIADHDRVVAPEVEAGHRPLIRLRQNRRHHLFALRRTGARNAGEPFRALAAFAFELSDPLLQGFDLSTRLVAARLLRGIAFAELLFQRLELFLE